LLLPIWALLYVFWFLANEKEGDLLPNEADVGPHWTYAICSPFRSVLLGALATVWLVLLPCVIVYIPVSLLFRACGLQWNPWWLFGPDEDIGFLATLFAGMGIFWLIDSTYGLFVALRNRQGRLTRTVVTVLPHMISLALLCLVVAVLAKNPPSKWGGSGFVHLPAPRFIPLRR